MAVNTQIAAAGQTDLSTAIDFTSKTMKAFGLEGAAATRVLGDLAFQAVQVGQFNFEALASNLPRVAADAQVLGAEIEEVIAAFAVLSGLYPSLNELSTGYSGVIRAFVSPTDEMLAALDKVRYRLIQQDRAVEDLTKSSGQLVVETLGLSGALDQIIHATEGNPSLLAEFFPDSSALGYVQRYNSLADDVAEVTGQLQNNTGGLNAAFSDLTSGLGTVNHLFNRLRSSILVIAEEIGLVLAPLFIGLFNLINPYICLLYTSPSPRD